MARRSVNAFIGGASVAAYGRNAMYIVPLRRLSLRMVLGFVLIALAALLWVVG